MRQSAIHIRALPRRPRPRLTTQIDDVGRAPEAGTCAERPDNLAENPPEHDWLSWNRYLVTLRDCIVVAIEEQHLP